MSPRVRQLGKLVGCLLGVVAFLVALTHSLTVIAIAWFAHVNVRRAPTRDQPETSPRSIREPQGGWSGSGTVRNVRNVWALAGYSYAELQT